MTDDEFLQAFMDCSLPATQFHHRDHLRLTWLIIRRRGQKDAERLVGEGIRRYAASLGQPEKYHETMTRFWIRIVGHMVEVRPDIAELETFIATFPQLLDKTLPFRHWSHEAMGSGEARRQWTEPDLHPLPAP